MPHRKPTAERANNAEIQQKMEDLLLFAQPIEFAIGFMNVFLRRYIILIKFTIDLSKKSPNK